MPEVGNRHRGVRLEDVLKFVDDQTESARLFGVDWLRSSEFANRGQLDDTSTS